MAPPFDREEQAAGRRGPETSGFGARGEAALDLELRADIVSASVRRPTTIRVPYASERGPCPVDPASATSNSSSPTTADGVDQRPDAARTRPASSDEPTPAVHPPAAQRAGTMSRGGPAGVVAVRR